LQEHILEVEEFRRLFRAFHANLVAHAERGPSPSALDPGHTAADQAIVTWRRTSPQAGPRGKLASNGRAWLVVIGLILPIGVVAWAQVLARKCRRARQVPGERANRTRPAGQTISEDVPSLTIRALSPNRGTVLIPYPFTFLIGQRLPFYRGGGEPAGIVEVTQKSRDRCEVKLLEGQGLTTGDRIDRLIPSN
jgi:hypothetical protein